MLPAMLEGYEWLPPSYLKSIILKLNQADIEQLRAAQDVACKDSIERMEATGQPMVTDGEQRASSFATYPLTDTLGGTGLADCLAGDGQYLFVFCLDSCFFLVDWRADEVTVQFSKMG